MKNLLKALLSSILISSFIFCWDKPFSKYNTYSINEDSTNKIEEVNKADKKEVQDKYYDYTIQNFDRLLKIQNIYKEVQRYENGNIRAVNFYKVRDKFTGGRDYLKSFHYYDNGLVKNETVYNLNGYGGCELKSYQYYENGNIESYSYDIPRYDDEQIICEKNGIDILYYENGKIYRETIWEDHTLIQEKYYHNDGILNYELNNGKFIYYNKDGSVRAGY